MKPVYCKTRGVVKEVWFEDRIYVIHSPASWESGYKRQQKLQEEGLEVYRLNTGVKEDAELAQKLLDLCLEFESE
jgi:hypothetical protein